MIRLIVTILGFGLIGSLLSTKAYSFKINCHRILQPIHQIFSTVRYSPLLLKDPGLEQEQLQIIEYVIQNGNDPDTLLDIKKGIYPTKIVRSSMAVLNKMIYRKNPWSPDDAELWGQYVMQLKAFKIQNSVSFNSFAFFRLSVLSLNVDFFKQVCSPCLHNKDIENYFEDNPTGYGTFGQILRLLHKLKQAISESPGLRFIPQFGASKFPQHLINIRERYLFPVIFELNGAAHGSDIVASAQTVSLLHWFVHDLDDYLGMSTQSNSENLVEPNQESRRQSLQDRLDWNRELNSLVKKLELQDQKKMKIILLIRWYFYQERGFPFRRAGRISKSDFQSSFNHAMDRLGSEAQTLSHPDGYSLDEFVQVSNQYNIFSIF